MFDKFYKTGNFSLLKKSLDNGENCSVFGLNIGEKLALLEDSAILFYIVDSVEAASTIMDKFVDMGRIPYMLTEDINPLTSEFEKSDKLMEFLYRLKNGEIDTVVLTANMLAARFPNPSRIGGKTIKIGDELSITSFIKELISFGYERVDIVAEKGQFSVRGDVVDIYPLSGSPTRIMTDFDEVESIRSYNPITLLTTSDLKECIIPKNILYQVSKEDIDNLYKELKIKQDDLYYDLTAFERKDYRLIAFDSGFSASIFDYAQNATIAFDGAKNIYDKLESYLSELKGRIKDSSLYKVLATKPENISKYLIFDKNHTLIAFHLIQQNNRIFSPQKVFSIRSLPCINYSNNWSVLGLDIKNFVSSGYTVILSAPSNEQTNKLKKFLDDNNINSAIYSRVSLAHENMVNIVNRKIPYSLTLPEEKLAVIGYQSLFGVQKKVIEAETGFFDGVVPNENDFVVHSVHGVGRCLGVKQLQISGGLRDYVVIEYKNNDKVYLPVENLNQLSKYIGADKTPTINKIGGAEFAKTKEKVKSAVKKIAFDLIALYRDRLNLKGLKFRPDDDMQKEFEMGFGFAETTDQLKAIEDCKSDLESGKVMDRLVCGDVGFGKTEVALRVAFKTILNGKQVAILCPTTILSEQHYNTAKSRMANFGVKIEVLNRLRSKQDVDRIKKDFAAGKIDLLCGTHKLLASDIDYKNLGLLILDEEQKFGVADKEKIKNIKKSVNVLTLSATPIPRTLNMSLIGVRDISVIETPPTQRLPSDVQVVEYNETLIKTAIERELDRGGQVLVIYNRVEKIYNFSSKIKNLCPNAVVSVAHGQMKENELEKEIYNLYTGKTQVLVATTLIENGVDLPNANTLIVINADMLGLSQLYQLKGRIGRSDKYSFAYFTFDNRKILSESAYKRLQAIKEFSELGRGFKIAMRDLEIRGAGSLLGAEQSGHIEKIGYNMYVQLLNESVKELRGEKVEKKTDIRVETNIPAYLSYDYVSSVARRMNIYRDISNIDSFDKLTELKNNIETVYGDMPEELLNLMKVALIKNNLSKVGVERVVLKSTTSLYFESRESLTKNVIDLVHNESENITLKMEDRPTLEIRIEKCEKILDYMIKISRLLGDF